MVPPAPTVNAGSLAAAVAVVALGVTVVVSGNDKPPEPTPPPAPTAVFQPAKVTLIATDSWSPFSKSWSADAPVRLRTSDAAAIKALASNAHTALASGGGDQLDLALEEAAVEGNNVTAKLRADNIPAAGEYSGKLSLDPLAEKSAALEVTVKARHPWLWPLLVLLAGIILGVGGTRLVEVRRRRQVLRVALIEVGAWLQLNRNRPGMYDLPAKLVGTNPNQNLFPRATDCRRETPSPGIPKLYCSIRTAARDDTLDELTKKVEALRTRVDVWYRAGNALEALRLAQTRLTDAMPKTIRTHTQTLTEMLADEQAGLAAEVVQAQARVVNVFAQTWALWVAAGSPSDSSPVAIYNAFPGATERTTADSAKLVGRLRELQAKLHSDADAPSLMLVEASTGGAVGSKMGLATPPVEDERPWEDHAGDRFPLVRDIRSNVRAWDAAMFFAHATIASLAFFLPVYTATNFGTLDQYLAMFAAGFLGKVALDQAGPIRSLRLAPAATPAAAPAAGGGGADDG